jgi:hypothetical protein
MSEEQNNERNDNEITLNDIIEIINNNHKRNDNVSLSILDGIIKMMKMIDEQKLSISSLSSQVITLQNIVKSQSSLLKDISIMVNNNSSDVEELNSKLDDISSKIDYVDNDIKNLKIYKYYSGE